MDKFVWDFLVLIPLSTLLCLLDAGSGSADSQPVADVFTTYCSNTRCDDVIATQRFHFLTIKMPS